MDFDCVNRSSYPGHDRELHCHFIDVGEMTGGWSFWGENGGGFGWELAAGCGRRLGGRSNGGTTEAT
jgi:hypothetical protein